HELLLAVDFGFGGGGTLGRVGVPNPDVLFGEGGIFFAASFSFLAFCVQSGQVTSLAFAD
ncbi:MAG: hypothetical protein M3Z24_02465, partial [Chloroflexota bacterium]|nr:hypothetical protein [Chloroflexota bacterium]